MPEVFFAASVAGLAFALNALWPRRGPLTAVPSFFGAWLTSELAPHLLAVHVLAVTAFVLNGALDGWPGWVGLGLSALIAGGLIAMVAKSHRVRHRLEDALREGLAVEMPGPPRLEWRRLVVPFWFRHGEVERVRNVAYAEGGRRFLLDVYRHRSHPSGRPVVLQIHGGGWTISNKDQQGKPLLLHMAARGWVCFAINYPLSPRATWPDHIVAVKRAIAWIREHGAEYGADPSFVLVTGGSAGGHLAALAALSRDDPSFQPGFENADTSVQAAVPYYGVYDFTATDSRILRMVERIVLKKRLSDARDLFEAASPLHRCAADAPPFFVIHGSKDSLVPVAEARAFVSRLRAVSRAPVAYAELPGAQHAFDVFPSIRTAHVVAAVERFADHAWAAWRAQSPDSATRLAHG